MSPEPAPAGDPSARLVEVRTRIGSPESAERIARALIDGRYAACAHVAPAGTSVYRWEGRVVVDEEVEVVCTTTLACLNETIAEVLRLHTYDLPSVQWHEVAATGPYARWVTGEVFRG